jgi:glutathione S-transferase
MEKLPLTSLATLLCVAVFFWTLLRVAQARTKYGVAAPAVTGNEMFERAFRVQMNTIEQMALLFPSMWLCAFWVGDQWAALGGVVWSAGRILYAILYQADPRKRGPGFTLTVLPSFVMAGAVLVTVVRSMI